MRFSLPALLSVLVFGVTPHVCCTRIRLCRSFCREVCSAVPSRYQIPAPRLNDADGIFFYEPGFEVLEIKAADANNIDVKIRIAPDCALGEHTAQVHTNQDL